jgi:hypothetical protein
VYGKLSSLVGYGALKVVQNKEKIMSFLNPGREVRETIKYRHARTQRTRFGQKAADAFFVFYGSFGLNERDTAAGKSSAEKSKLHFGVFDYLTFGILYALTALSVELLIRPRSIFPKIIGGIFSAIFAIPRAIFAGVFTFISLPIIGITQAIASSKGERWKSRIREYPMPVDLPAPNNKTTLGVLFKKYGLRISDITRIEKEIIHEKNMPLGEMRLKLEQGSGFFNVVLPIDKKSKFVNKKDGKFFKALRRLNVGDLQYQIEQKNAQIAAAVQNSSKP